METFLIIQELLVYNFPLKKYELRGSEPARKIYLNIVDDKHLCRPHRKTKDPTFIDGTAGQNKNYRENEKKGVRKYNTQHERAFVVASSGIYFRLMPIAIAVIVFIYTNRHQTSLKAIKNRYVYYVLRNHSSGPLRKEASRYLTPPEE